MSTPTTPDVANRVLDIAYELTARSGPDSVSVREVQRQAGVSAATAYWHFKNRADLMLAVSRRATAALADSLGDASENAPSPQQELTAVCLAYLHFARDHEGLFRAVISNSSADELERPHGSARGRSGYAAFEILQQAVAGVAAAYERTYADDAALHVWAACHGLAAVLLDTPMAHIPEAEKERLRRQHVAFVVDALVPDHPRE
ncbi:TetR/AcrR family transcriptional regulator [Nocardioides sp. NPDC059952]|uniref:TetR/AcrR family transcriptional regulator n=1 Tax=Nocardioides sp. NPDC059952 TaxID=3347014 RepID=UPI0036534CF5